MELKIKIFIHHCFVLDVLTPGSCRRWKFYIQGFLGIYFVQLCIDPGPDDLSSLTILYIKMQCNSAQGPD